VWPFDKAFCGAGLKRYGFFESARRIFDGIVTAASHFPLHRLPEVFCGFSRDEYQVPIPIRTQSTRKPGRPARCLTC
jgi:glycogen debranching enzyme